MRTSSLSILLFAACASAPPSPAPTEPSTPLGVALASNPSEITRETLAADEEPVAAQPRPEARQLLGAVNALDRAKPDAGHERVVEALRALDAVVETLAPAQGGELQRLRDATQQLDRSDPSAQTHAAFVRTALDAARRAMQATRPRPPADGSRYLVEVAAFRDETMKLSTDVPLLEQYAQLRTAFQAATRAVFAGEGATEPTFEVRSITAER
jgi:hypothetical protein